MSASRYSMLLKLGWAVGLTAFAAGCDAGTSSRQGEDVECPAAACGATEHQGNTCDAYDQLSIGKYRVLNNLWGIEEAMATGQQCIWSTCDESDAIAWGTNFQWASKTSGQVVSYTAALLGWHYSDIDPASGLPVQIAERRKIECTWSYRLTQTGQTSQNVAYDIWLSDTPTPGSSGGQTDEIMIWLFHSGSASPIGGPPVESVEIDGARWSLHEGSVGGGGGGWKVHSFVRQVNTPCATLNLADFFQHLVDHYGLDENKYVVGIEAGAEIFSGNGELQTDRYSCDVE